MPSESADKLPSSFLSLSDPVEITGSWTQGESVFHSSGGASSRCGRERLISPSQSVQICLFQELQEEAMPCSALLAHSRVNTTSPRLIRARHIGQLSPLNDRYPKGNGPLSSNLILQPVGLSRLLWVIKNTYKAHFSVAITPASVVCVQKLNSDAGVRLAGGEPTPFISVILKLCIESENSSTVDSISVWQYPGFADRNIN